MPIDIIEVMGCWDCLFRTEWFNDDDVNDAVNRQRGVTVILKAFDAEDAE